MRLQSISIKNFRCLKEVRDIPIHNLTILIGENDSGKSSVLDALDIVLDKKKVPSSDDYYVCEGQPHESEIAIEIIINYTGDEEKPLGKFLNGDGNLQYRVTYRQGSSSTEVKGIKFSDNRLNTNFTKLKAGEFDEILDQLGIEFEGRRNPEIRLQLIEEYIERENPETTEDWIEAERGALAVHAGKRVDGHHHRQQGGHEQQDTGQPVCYQHDAEGRRPVTQRHGKHLAIGHLQHQRDGHAKLRDGAKQRQRVLQEAMLPNQQQQDAEQQRQDYRHD